MCQFTKVFCVFALLLFFITLSNGDGNFYADNNNRDKRTLDLLWHKFAHIFGHDVHKPHKPTAIPPPKPKPKPKPEQPPPKPADHYPAPKRVTPHDVLKEIVRKSFNVNFNWKDHKQPQIPILPKKPAAPAPQPPKMHIPPPLPPPTKMHPAPPPPPPPPKMHPMPMAPPKMLHEMPMMPPMHPAPPKPIAPPPKIEPKKPAPIVLHENEEGYFYYHPEVMTEKQINAPQAAPKMPAQMEQHHNEDEYFYYQPDAHENYEHFYEHPVDFSKYTEHPQDAAQKQHEDVKKVQKEIEKKIEKVANSNNKEPAPIQAQSPEHHDEEQHFHKYYEDFANFDNKKSPPQQMEQQEEQKGAVTTSLHDFWQKSPMKNDHGYKFLVEENTGHVEQHPVDDFMKQPAENHHEEDSNYDAYFYLPEVEEEATHGASEKKQSDYGMKITDVAYPHEKELKHEKVQLKKNVNEHGSFIPTKFDGDATFIPTKLQRLHHEDTKVFSVGPSPFDHAYDGSQVKSKAIQKPGDATMNNAPQKKPVEEDPRFVYFYQPDSYDNDYTFTVSPQKNEEIAASAVPKLHAAEDDKDLSRNAKVKTKEYAKRIVSVHKTANTRQNA